MITGKKASRSQCDLHIHGKHDSQIQYDQETDSKHLRQLPAHKVTDHFHVRGTSLNDSPVWCFTCQEKGRYWVW